MVIPFWTSLRAKTIYATLLSSLFLSLILFFSLTWLSESSFFTASEEWERSLFEQNQKIVSNWFKERKHEAFILSKNPLIQSMDLPLIHTYLRENLPVREGPILQYFVADSTGTYTTSIVPTPGSISQREYFSQVMKGESVISSPLRSLSTTKEIIAVTVPVISKDNQILGLVGISLDLSRFHAFFTQLLQTSKNTELMMVDEKGTIIFHLKESLIGSTIQPLETGSMTALLPEQADFILSEDQGSATYHNPTKKSDVLLLFGKIEGTPEFRLISFVPQEELHTFVRKMQIQLLFLSLGLLLVVFISIYLVAGVWTKHFLTLKVIFDKVAEGDLSVIAPENENREIGQVSQSFNMMMKTVRSLTYFDPITNLPNRYYFEDFVKKSLKKEINVGYSSIIVLTVDKFKNFNDNHGGGLGDDLLKQIGKRLIRTLENGAMISRGNGAEFNIFLADASSHSVTLSGLEKLFKDSSIPFLLADEKVYITYSAGVAFFLSDAANFEELLIHASIARNAAKKAGGGTFKTFNDSMKLGLSRQMQIEAHMHIAIEYSQFHLVFQPQVDVLTNEISGMEALIRWDSPELGTIPPSVFIPIAEESGLIRQIGSWVMETACRQNKLWMDEGCCNVPVSVNVSSIQFDQSNFIQETSMILETTQLPAHFLELEITERIAMGKIEETLSKLNEIHGMGIKISLDDFGTGYSSLNYFKDFPINTLKIDQSFIRDIPRDPNTMAIIETVISMGKNLRVDIVAEGVETLEQYNFIKNNGCHKIQGYYFSKPLSSEEMGRKLKAGKIFHHTHQTV